VEVSNHQIKQILEKAVAKSRRDGADKLIDTFCTYQMASKTPLGMSPYRTVWLSVSFPLGLNIELGGPLRP